MAKKKNKARADGRISVQVYIGRDAEGKRKYKTVYGTTQKEADEKALQVKLSMKKGLDVTAERDTFSDWADRWVKIKAIEVSNGQMAAYRSAVKYLIEALGFFQINKIKPIDLQEIINALAIKNPSTKRPSSKKTLLNIKITASQIFQMAIENRMLEYNPAQALKIPANAPKQTRRALTANEQAWIVDTPHEAQITAMIMLYAGLRRGELIPLTWNDINFEKRTITIDKSVEKQGSNFILKHSTKTAAGMRVIHIPNRLINFLNTQPHRGIYVCCRKDGRMHTESS